MRAIIFLSLFTRLFFCGIFNTILYADIAGTNYAVTRDFISGGGRPAASASYKIEEGSVDFVSKEPMTSVNYKVEGQIGGNQSPAAPVIEAVSPDTPSRFFTDESPSYTVTGSNSGAGTLEYCLLNGSTVKRQWAAQNVLTYAVSNQDKGRHFISIQARNNEGVTTGINHDQYLFRRPLK